MQVRALPRQIIRGATFASRLAAQTPSIEAARRDAILRRWHQARRDGLTADQAADAVGASRASLYRWDRRAEPLSRRPHTTRPRTWTPDLIAEIERLRADFPMWGRAKLGPLLRSQGFPVSNSTTGRIIAHLVARGRVVAVPTLRRRPRSHRWTPRRHHAIRLPKGLKPSIPGGLVQIDTLSVNVAPDRAIKHFTAYDPVAKWTVGLAAERATASSAARFLDKVLRDMPFPVQAIQVDGGSEFKAAFEQACARHRITLYELPPKRPQLNGAVERCNGAWRYEFYSVYDLSHRIADINPILDAFQHLYNHHRPHGALAGRTPAAHLSQRPAAVTPPSHMS